MRYVFGALIWKVLSILARFNFGWDPVERWPPDDPRDEFLQLERNRYTGSMREVPR